MSYETTLKSFESLDIDYFDCPPMASKDKSKRSDSPAHVRFQVPPVRKSKPPKAKSKPAKAPRPKDLYSHLHRTLLGAKFPNSTGDPDLVVVSDSKKDTETTKTSAISIDAPLLGFGHLDVRRPQDMYLKQYGRGSTGSVTTKTELGLHVTDFFDYAVFDSSGVAQQVTNYFWSVDQNLFQNGESASPFDDRERTFCRVRKVDVYVLPAKGFEIGTTGPNETNATGMFTVNCQVPGVSSVNAQAAVAMDTQVTNVLPQIDTFWKKVFSCDLQKTFQSGVVKPYFDTVVDNSAQCIFQMCIVDPTDGSQYLPNSTEAPDFSIRVKVCLHVDQPIATIQNAKLRVFRNESFITPSLNINGPAFQAPDEEYVQVNLNKSQDYMR
jgi:hypothetical protein